MVRLLKCDEKIGKIREQIEKDKEYYCYPMKVDIII